MSREAAAWLVVGASSGAGEPFRHVVFPTRYVARATLGRRRGLSGRPCTRTRPLPRS